MANRILPTVAGIYAFAYLIELDPGVSHRLEFRFNGADRFWYLDLRNSAGEDLVLGMRLTLGPNKWGRYKHKPGVPRGALEVVDVAASGVQAGADDLGRRVLVRYDAEATG